MPINEQKLQSALDKISIKKTETQTLLKQYDAILNGIMSIRRIKVEDFDETTGVKTGEHWEVPMDSATLKPVSEQRRQEIIDALVSLIEAL